MQTNQQKLQSYHVNCTIKTSLVVALTNYKLSGNAFDL